MGEAEASEAEERAELEGIRRRLADQPNAVAVAAQLNEGILDSSGLDLRTFHLVRAAAMAASGSSKLGWDVMLELMDDEVTPEKVEGTLVAIAPIIGSSRYLEAVSRIVAD